MYATQKSNVVDDSFGTKVTDPTTQAIDEKADTFAFLGRVLEMT